MPDLDDRQRRILDGLVAHARPLMLTEFSADSCIAASRIGLDVLEHFHIPAQEYPLFVAIYNPEAVALLQAGVPMSEVTARTRQITAQAPGGPWTLGLGATPRTGGRANGWSGHLVIGLPDHQAVIDLSADQASRPHKNIHLTPYWAPVSNPDWFIDPTAREFLSASDGMLLVLDRSAVPDPTGYRQSPNWRRRVGGRPPSLYRAITGQIIRAIRADLNGADRPG